MVAPTRVRWFRDTSTLVMPPLTLMLGQIALSCLFFISYNRWTTYYAAGKQCENRDVVLLLGIVTAVTVSKLDQALDSLYGYRYEFIESNIGESARGAVDSAAEPEASASVPPLPDGTRG